MEDLLRILLKDKIPTDSSMQVDVFQMINLNNELFNKTPEILLDLGAGDGGSYEPLKRRIQDMHYIGLDIENSPEVSRRTREDLEFQTYDGINIPFSDSYFSTVFCKQVLEHVRYPDNVIAEVARVLKPGGVFIGSVSQLEPYHSHSIFNWTAYGIINVFQSHGLNVKQIRPSIDGISLIYRRLFGNEKFNAFFGFESIYNHYIDGILRTHNNWKKNYNKLIIAGHIIWIAVKE